MTKYLSVLKHTRLFAGVHENEIESMLGCLGARARTYKKGEYVLRAGEHPACIAMPVSGELHIQKDDFWGNRSIVSRVSAGEMLGESYIAPESGVLLTDAVAASDSTVLFFDVQKLMTTCSSACRFHTAVVQNLLYAVAEKNRALVQKLGHMSKRTTREKLLSYLSEQAARANSNRFCIPFNRQQLADFLSVDRSAMSAELCKLRDEGLLVFKKNNFELKEVR